MGVDGLIPAIVTRAEFEAAHAGRRRQSVSSGETTKHLVLLGLARCAGCGRTVKAKRRNRADGTYVQSYFCNDVASEPCSDRAYVHADALDAFVAEWFEAELRATPRMIDAVAAAHDLEQAEAELEAADAELRAFVTLSSALERAVFLDGAQTRQERVEAARACVREL